MGGAHVAESKSRSRLPAAADLPFRRLVRDLRPSRPVRDARPCGLLDAAPRRDERRGARAQAADRDAAGRAGGGRRQGAPLSGAGRGGGGRHGRRARPGRRRLGHRRRGGRAHTLARRAERLPCCGRRRRTGSGRARPRPCRRASAQATVGAGRGRRPRRTIAERALVVARRRHPGARHAFGLAQTPPSPPSSSRITAARSRFRSLPTRAPRSSRPAPPTPMLASPSRGATR